ncbi:helix-turn-helix domain-containing protein [Naumannella halotolerans]|uniref:HTH cro/C1-type domain-containing protein n=1 Tax=Naumannella halotolerans TaxID=993414 RepID=A0A4R7J5J8_9ACTN|nr:helix-turn-helix transcriptional regulator [Naumannella halotolerans]TDT32484.1 hypothetical protein CLV29_0062 [Naumannella halotolerans]
MAYNQIRAARESRGWSQSRLVAEIERAAQANGVSLMTRGSLTTALSRWENGHVAPKQHHRSLLRATLGIDLDDGHNTGEPIGQAMTLVQVDAQAEVLSAIRRSDRHGLAHMTNPQLDIYAAALRGSLGTGGPLPVRIRLAALLADAEALIAWQLIDLSQPAAALSRYRRAEQYARDAEDAHLIAHARAGQAVALIDLDHPDDAHQLMQATRAQAEGKVSTLFWAWLLAANAETGAAAGDGRTCRESVRAAFDVLPDGQRADPALPYITLGPAHLQRWAGHSLSMIGERSAIDMLEEAAEAMPIDFVRARGSLHTDMAECHALLGHKSDARRERGTALELVQESGSRRQQRRLNYLVAA